MTSLRFILFASSVLAVLSGPSSAQTIDLKELLRDLKAAEQEEAAAREVRLKWISEERARIRDEQRQYEQQLTDLQATLPDPIKPRIVPKAVAKAQSRERLAFNDWASSRDPGRQVEILRGRGLNALIQVLGPIAHYRRLRKSSDAVGNSFNSLAKRIESADATHYRMVPPTSSGSKVTVRLNRTPLDLEWPPILLQTWPSDCQSIAKLRDEFVSSLTSTKVRENSSHLAAGELLDSALELLQAKVLQRKGQVSTDRTLATNKRTETHRELQQSLRSLETVRATAARFRTAPGDFKVHHFSGGSIEDFLDFCYTHGLIFQEAQPSDEEYYHALFRQLQDYAYDVQFVEDWKDDVEQRLRELEARDQQLLWQAAKN